MGWAGGKPTVERVVGSGQSGQDDRRLRSADGTWVLGIGNRAMITKRRRQMSEAWGRAQLRVVANESPRFPWAEAPCRWRLTLRGRW